MSRRGDGQRCWGSEFRDGRRPLSGGNSDLLGDSLRDIQLKEFIAGLVVREEEYP